MIAIRHGNIRELNNWYERVMADYLDGRKSEIQCDANCSSWERELAAELKALTKEELRLITLFPTERNAESAFLDRILNPLRASRPRLREYMDLCDSGDFQAEQGHAIVKKLFDYDRDLCKRKDEEDGETLLRHLKQKMNVPVCPYCNRQYIHTVDDNGKRPSLADADHVLPKSRYPLFSLSLWNLVPCCMPCNRIFKLKKTKPLLNPHFCGFGNECVLELRCQSADAIAGTGELSEMDPRWTVQAGVSAEVRERMENNIGVFRLNEVYRYHKGDMQKLLRKRYRYESASYWKSVSQIIGDAAPEALYGASLDPARFQEEPLSKMIYDAIQKN